MTKKMKAIMMAGAAGALLAGCGSEPESDDLGAKEELTSPTIESVVPAVFCKGSLWNGDEYYVQFLNPKNRENEGVCTTLEVLTQDQWMDLDLNKQCDLSSSEQIEKRGGIVTYYGLIGDQASLDAAVTICEQSGGQPAPGRL